jgi:hypothetical protein
MRPTALAASASFSKPNIAEYLRPTTCAITKLRLILRFMVSAPERWTLQLVGASEMAGCVLFRALRDKGIELFADEPPVAERIRLLYNEILADEIGHVGFIAARLTERGRKGMRLLYGRMTSTFARQSAEVVALFGRRDGQTSVRVPARRSCRRIAEPDIRGGADLSVNRRVPNSIDNSGPLDSASDRSPGDSALVLVCAR